MAAMYTFIEFILKCIFVYPFTLSWKAGKFIVDRIPQQRPALPVIAVKTRPATPEETRGAVNQMLLAHRLFLKSFEEPENTALAMKLLGQASTALNTARSLDPGASATVEQYKEQTTYTVDELSGNVLHAQGALMLHGVDVLRTGKWPDDMSTPAAAEWARNQEKMNRHYRTEALAAAQQALAYSPKSVKYRILLAKALRANKKPKDAKVVLQEAHRLEPDNIDVLELMNDNS